MSESKSKDKDPRSKNWTIILYPESAPSNWREIIEEWHIEFVVSPLHDKDKDPTGELKKPHYHLLLMYGSLKSYEQVIQTIDELKCPIPKKVHNTKSLVRYMIHLDNPDKFQYNSADLKSYGGVDLQELLRPSSSERYSIISDMMSYIKQESITEYYVFSDYCRIEHFDDWFPLLCDNSSIVITGYINSMRHSQKNKIVDPITGEIL